MNLSKTQFFDFLNGLSSEAPIEQENGVVLFEKKAIAVYFNENLIERTQYFFRDLIEKYSQKNIKLIVIFEYQWVENQQNIRSRIESMFDKSISIHGRKTKFIRIDKAQAEIFLNKNHLQSYVSSKFKYGLFLQNELMAVATFSAGRKKKEMAENLRSFELIRFANKSGFRVIGGLSKLLTGFVKNHNVGDIMTYLDVTWSDGAGYQKIGFEVKGFLEPFKIKLEEYTIWNAGSFKLVLEEKNLKHATNKKP